MAARQAIVRGVRPAYGVENEAGTYRSAMIRAAGIMIVSPRDTVLFLRRGNGSDHPNEWCFPGGHLEDCEDARAAAVRECAEEAGRGFEPGALREWTRTLAPADPQPGADPLAEPAPSQPVDFTTFMVRVTDEFAPTLALDEHDGYAWAPLTAPPQPLHPGCAVALDRMSWDELGVARAMAEGRLSSPQRYENVWLFAIRITGTGLSYRHARKEYVWRDPSIYVNDEFLARCAGLAVIWEHPEKSLLNEKEYADRAIGSIMLPYLRPDRPDEVWGIAKVYDDEAARLMREEVMSTSPAVNFADPLENDRVVLEDGKVLLIEGKPSLLDHIAICQAGVWDKGGPPDGVESVEAESAADSVASPPPSGIGAAALAQLTAMSAALSLRVV